MTFHFSFKRSFKRLFKRSHKELPRPVHGHAATGRTKPANRTTDGTVIFLIALCAFLLALLAFVLVAAVNGVFAPSPA